MNRVMRKWAAVAFLGGILATGAALGEDHGSCYEAYLESGFSPQQMTFDEFRWFYGDDLCAPDGEVLGATGQQQALGESK